MAVTVTDAWRAAVQRRNPRLRYVAEINDGSTSWKCLDASSDVLDRYVFPVGLAAPPSSVGAELDPFTREVTVNEIVCQFRDKYLRPILVNNVLKGQALTVYMGAAELAWSDYCYYGSGVIDTPLGDGKKRVITVTCKDPFAILEDTEITGAWIDKHPLEIIYDGTSACILSKVGIPAALIDTAAFDPSNYTGSISHWNMLRGGNIETFQLTLSEPESALDVANHLAMLLNGNFIIDAQGRFSFARFDASASVAATWTDVEVISCEHVATREEIINEMIVGFWASGSLFSENETGMLEWQDSDSDSKTAHAYKGGDPRAFSKKVTTSWINGWAQLCGTLPNDTDTSMTIGFKTLYGFTGARQAMAGGGQPAECTLSAGRPAYYLIRGNPPDMPIEIVKVTAATPITTVWTNVQYNDPDSDGAQVTVGPYLQKLTLNTVARGQFDTSGVDWSARNGGHVHDITILVEMTDQIIKRFGGGIDILEVVTGMGEMDKYLADLVAIVDDDFVGYGADGLDGSTKFEIVQREPRPEDGQITWRVATAALNSPTRVYGGRVLGPLIAEEAGRAAISSDVTRQHVISGLESSTDSGFKGIISAGIVWLSPVNRHHTKVEYPTYAASKDTYITYSGVHRKIGFHEVPNLDPTPEIGEDEMWVAKVVTDGSGITGHTDLRELYAIDSLDKVDDGTTYKRVASVSSAHQVQPASIASAAVTAGKIATGGVSASAQIAANIVGVRQQVAETAHGLSPNPTFNDWYET